MRGRWMVAGVVAGAVALAGCGASPDARARGEDDPALASFYDQSLDWSTCEDNPWLECATLMVPLDYAAPDGEVVDLAVYRDATTREPQSTIVIMPGGPGTGGQEALRGGLGLQQLALDNHLVSYDARSVGATIPFRCEDEAAFRARASLDATPDTPAEEEALVTALETYAAACMAASGGRLPMLGTRQSVHDLDILRNALGEDGLAAYAFSYGSLVGAEYVRAFPGRVSRLVLDAPRTAGDLTDPSRVALMVAEAEARFDDALAACLGNQSRPCLLGEDPQEARAAAEALLLALDTDPVDLGADGLLTRERAVGVLWDLMSEGEVAWRVAVRALELAANGDWSELILYESDPTRSTTPDAAAAIRCADLGAHAPSRSEIRALAAEQAGEFPVFGETAAWWLLGCPGWPATEPLERSTDAVTSDAEVLVVTSTGDPLTPRAFAEDVAEQTGAAILTYTGPEHVAYAWSDCVRFAVNRFLVDGVLPQADTCGSYPPR